jgi:serine/threonine protein kinase/WD40 repeat protein
VVKALEEYTAELEAGRTPCREDYLSRMPEIAEILIECFDALEFVRGVAPQWKTAAVDLASPCPATPLGDFSLVREIGRGGMGVVYEAVQLSLGRRVALKVLPFAATLDARQLQRFHNEARAAAQLHHTHIVPVYGIGAERGVHYYAMQFIEGKSLAALILELRAASGMIAPPAADERLNATTDYTRGPGDNSRASTSQGLPQSTHRSVLTSNLIRTMAELGVQAAEALDHAHQFGVVHRDVKPANLLLDGREQLWVTDFGLAQVQSDARLTVTGDVVGTLRYMSPEQALARRGVVDHRTDVYSLGATLYELLTLEPPFAGQDRQELLRQIAEDEPAALRRRNRAIPIELQTIVLKAMAKNPADRYGTAQELADDLRRFLEDKPIRARRPNLVQRAVKLARRHKPLVVSLTLSLTLLLAGLLMGALVYADKKETALRASNERLYLALLDHAEALQTAREPGYRAHVWNDLRTATSLDGPWNDPARVRASVLACLGDPIGLDPVAESLGMRARPVVPEVFQGIERPANPADLLTAATPDGKTQAVWCYERFSLGVRLESGAAWTTRTLPLGRMHDLKFSPDGKLLVAGCDEGFMVWSLPGLTTRSFVLGGTTRSIAIHPHGHLLATLSRNVELWSLASNRLVASFRAPKPNAQVEFSADGKHLLVVAEDQVLKAWPIDGTPEKQRLDGHQGGAPAIAFSPDGRLLASVSKDLTVKIWDADTGALRQVCKGHRGAIEAVGFSPDGKLLASGDFRGVVHVWDASTGNALATMGDTACPGQIWRLQFDPAGRLLVAGGAWGIAAWAIDANHRVAAEKPCWRLEWTRVYDLAIHPNGAELAFLDQSRADLSGRIFVYDFAHAAVPRMLPVRARVQIRGLQFDPASERLLYTSSEGAIGIWDWRQAAVVPPAGRKALHLAVSGDGQWIATASPEHEVVVYDRDAERPILTLPAESSEIWCLAWRPDGTQLAASLSDGGVVIWNLEEVRVQLAQFKVALPRKGN